MTTTARPPQPVHFHKMNGLGNEILVVDARGPQTPPPSDDVKAMAIDPRTRFDQMMLLTRPRRPGTEAFVVIFNADGSESSACGNGTRCIGWLESRNTGRSTFQFETKAGLLDVHVENIDRVTVDMGEPRFAWNEIPLAEPFHDTRAIELQIGPIDAPVLHSPSVVNVGNPHAIFWVTDVDSYDLAKFGPMLENHPIFPERANISLAEVRSGTDIKLRVWERGTGLTQACGTAACAAAVAAMRKKLVERSVTVHLPGGKLQITWTPGNRILMTGPVVYEYAGDWTRPAVAAGI
ncbi:MAG: diaminopimelate epimerase [Hyphomicrobium sp.]|jgi:diaminopimelate epimerase|nr:diaminopimelate epimerase [Hyphomicrobium sp.]